MHFPKEQVIEQHDIPFSSSETSSRMDVAKVTHQVTIELGEEAEMSRYFPMGPFAVPGSRGPGES